MPRSSLGSCASSTPQSAAQFKVKERKRDPTRGQRQRTPRERCLCTAALGSYVHRRQRVARNA